MSDNVYEPPKANLRLDGSQDTSFYVVSKRKFWILYVSTFGFYQLYWFYQHWSHEKTKTGAPYWPVARAIFAVFFTHALFKRIATADAQVNRDIARQPLSLTGYATVFVIISVVGYFLEDMFPHLSSVMAWMVYIVMIPLEAWLLFKAQAVANRLSNDSRGTQNHDMTTMSYVGVLLGILFWLLVLFSEFGDAVFALAVHHLLGGR